MSGTGNKKKQTKKLITPHPLSPVSKKAKMRKKSGSWGECGVRHPRNKFNTEGRLETIRRCFGVWTVRAGRCTNRIFHLPWLNWNIWDSGYYKRKLGKKKKIVTILTSKGHFVIKPYKITCWCRLNCKLLLFFLANVFLSILLFYREFTRFLKKKINKCTR